MKYFQILQRIFSKNITKAKIWVTSELFWRWNKCEYWLQITNSTLMQTTDYWKYEKNIITVISNLLFVWNYCKLNINLVKLMITPNLGVVRNFSNGVWIFLWGQKFRGVWDFFKSKKPELKVDSNRLRFCMEKSSRFHTKFLLTSSPSKKPSKLKKIYYKGEGMVDPGAHPEIFQRGGFETFGYGRENLGGGVFFSLKP